MRVSGRERESERKRERECVCGFMSSQSEKGHASERNETHNTARSARTRRCRRPTRMAAVDVWQQSAVRLAGSAAASSSFCRSGTGSSRNHSARQCSRRRRPSLRRALTGPLSARTSVCARFTLFSHVVWFRNMISPGSTPARTALSSLNTTPRRPLGAPSRAPTPRRCHLERSAFFGGI